MIQDVFASRRLHAAHPACQDRLTFQLGVRLQLFGDLGGISHALRCHDDEQPIAVRVLGCDLHSFGIALWSRVAKDIDGIAVTPVRRQDFIQRLHGSG